MRDDLIGVAINFIAWGAGGATALRLAKEVGIEWAFGASYLLMIVGVSLLAYHSYKHSR